MKNNGTLIFAGIVVLAFVAYQALVVVPQKRIDAQETQFLFNQTKLEECRNDIVEQSRNHWNEECLVNGLDTNGPDCRLPFSIADRINEQYNNSLNRCVEAYK